MVSYPHYNHHERHHPRSHRRIPHHRHGHSQFHSTRRSGRIVDKSAEKGVESSRKCVSVLTGCRISLRRIDYRFWPGFRLICEHRLHMTRHQDLGDIGLRFRTSLQGRLQADGIVYGQDLGKGRGAGRAPKTRLRCRGQCLREAKAGHGVDTDPA